MFSIKDPQSKKDVFALRPMTCPFQFMIYKSEVHSYIDLPVRYSETSTMFRNENSGEMHGLIRIRQFTLSDGHIIVTAEQIEDEFKKVLKLIQKIMNDLKLTDIYYRFSKWDPNKKDKYINDPAAWEVTEEKMLKILIDLKIDFVEGIGEAAFYGPKLDIQMKNVYGKEDTLITIQIDFASAKRFEMFYVDKDGDKKFPYVIHRSSIGCYERTLALLIEKYAGALPVWLSLLQVIVVPISENQHKYAEQVFESLKDVKLRVSLDRRNEKLGFKIREAQMEKIPYILIIGEKEVIGNTVSVRSRKNEDLGVMKLSYFIEKITEDITKKI
jgi:threonyl-tRNA synthetase